MHMPRTGETFRGHYTIEEKLGEGAFGRVYRANDERTGRRVAIKVLKPNKKQEYRESRVKRFKREAKVVAALEHPNIVTLYDFGKSKRGLLYTVSEFIEGEDLQVEMQRRGRFPPLAVIHVMKQITLALREAHKAGVVHRDLKPANIRVFEYDGDKLRIKVLDFGLAAWSEEDDDDGRLTREGSSVGTPRYMSPEQLRGNDVTAAADFYALGLIAFEMLFGMHTRNLNYAADGRDVEVPDNEEVGRTLTNLVERLLRYHVRERPGSASEILALLDKAREELKTGAPADTVAQKLPPYYRPNVDRDLRLEEKPSPIDKVPTWAIGLGAGLLIGLVAIAMLTTLGGESDTRVVLPPSQPGVGAAFTQPAPDVVPEPKIVPDAGAHDPALRGCGKTPEFEQLGELTVLDGLDQHSWMTYIPTSYDPNVAAPLVVLLHDRLQPPDVALADSRLVDAAHEHGLLLIVPRHGFLPFGDDSGESVTKLRRIVEWTRDALCVDDQQILVVGLGTTAPAAYDLRCEPWVSGVVPVNWNRQSFLPITDACERKVPVLSVANVDQQLSKPGPLSQNAWHEQAGCNGEPREVYSQENSYCHTWNCDVPYESCFAGVRWGVSQRYAQRRARMQEVGMVAPGTELQRSMQAIVDFPTGQAIWSFWQRAVATEKPAN